SVKSQGGSAEVSYSMEGVNWNITMAMPNPTDVLKAPGIAADAASDDSRRSLQRTAAPRLAGRDFLVIEDEPLVALDVTASLEDAGARVLAQAGTRAEALRIIATRSFDAAVLDGNLHGHSVEEIAAALTQRRVPFIFVTGYGRDSLPRAFRGAAYVAKPFTS